MLIRCSQSELLKALSIVNRAVNTNNTLPVLNNIKITAENGQITLSATNLELAINSSIMAETESSGSITVPAKTMMSYVSLLKDEMLELNLKGTDLDLKSTGSATNIKGISSEEFPLLPKVEGLKNIVLPAEAVRNAIEMVVFSASTNISRPVLTGVLWIIKGDSLKLVATDSYRLSEFSMPIEESVQEEISFILPARSAQELSKIISTLGAESLQISIGSGQIMFSMNGVELISRLIDGSFPDYERILPTELKTEASVSTEDFMLALKKISVIVRENSNNMKMTVGDGKIEIFSDETQVGSSKSEILAETKGESQTTSLNTQYLIDLLSKIKDERADLGLNDKLSPVKLSPAYENGYVHIIMPLKA